MVRAVAAGWRALLALLVVPLIALALVGGALAQEADGADNPLDPLDTSSPSATFQSFLRETRRLQDAYADYVAHKTRAKELTIFDIAVRTQRLFDLEPLPPAIREKVGSAAITYLVDILNRLPEVSAADIPGAPGKNWGELPAKWHIPGTDIQIAKVASGPHAGEYLFTAESLERLPRDYALIIHRPPLRPVVFDDWHRLQSNFTGPFFPDSLQGRLPAVAFHLVLDTPLWKVVLSVALVLAVFAAASFWARLARRARRGASRVAQLGWRLSTPLLLILLYVLAAGFIRLQIHLSGEFSTSESIFSNVVIYGAGAWLAWNVCFFLAEAVIASPRIPDNSYDAHLLRLAARLGGILAVGAFALYGANNIGIPALGLVAGLGVGGIAVALASQSTLENLIGGLSIFADRPFRIGDSIRFEGQLADVEAIGPRSVRIRALDGTLITVPNGDLAKRHIINVSRRNKCLFLHEIGVRYETSPEQLQWLLAELRGVLLAHPMVEKSGDLPRVALTGFADSAITIQIRAHILTTQFEEFLRIQGQLLLDIARTVNAAGTGFAFPSQTAYLTRDTGIDTARQAEIATLLEERAKPHGAPGSQGSGRDRH